MSKSTVPKKTKPHGHQRSFSASEIARNMHHFETWSTYQHCDQASYSDIPDEFKNDVEDLFNVHHRLSKFWLDKPDTCSEGMTAFLKSAFEASPDLFSTTAITEDEEVLEEISVVYLAWKRLRKMRSNSEKWSEAEYVANVYNLFRSPAIRESTYRVQCTVSLPRPLTVASDDALRVMNTKTAIPDCGIFLPASLSRPLSHSAKSPYKVLKNHPTIAKAGTVTRGSSFRYQSTPRAQPPEMPGFEFVSSLWEDKKPVHNLLDDAYRQNRIATASAARHLHSLNIRSPVIGLIWANGTVRAHIDWCEAVDGKPVVMSAPYSGVDRRCEFGRPFHEWVLDNPCDILRVYFVVRNIDRWTCGRFHDRVVAGLKNLVETVIHGEGSYHPWKWDGSTTSALTSRVLKENITLSAATTISGISPSPPKPKCRRRRRRSSQ